MVLVNSLSEIVFIDDPFRSLQFLLHRKLFVRRLVEGFHGSRDGRYDDVIQVKGKGLIFLLYGPPGLGKTLTAASVAEVSKRPLYHISAGELNTKVSASEIVAVFLQMLEYYNGMFFLTTNRRDDFDHAFFNRIHVTIEYGELDPVSRTNIWRYHLQRAILENTRPSTWSEQMYETLGRIQLNGRDIKNYVRAAYASTHAVEGEDLELEQVLIVLRNSLPGSDFHGSNVCDSKGSDGERALQELGDLRSKI
ncbi:P-loop containing nucleoside triphosphate hydrolase protein [Paramyrothecium foliicola]|nr:P-loop containing nucleoside triphosphate hydrolase protein [Paramyrothecium foliicola]